ncbi:MAG TPA: GGDEF domain-containing protein [Syntrophales bacterium]|nr:GGDEF domain-containing protein [Syntrophales bacterium]HQQ27920.1 GGDEF domain-containing protein [Syntrophales bacterium]
MDEIGPMGESYGYIRLALPLMSKYNIPVTPHNYTVWYRYVSGADPKLAKTIDTLLEKEGPFSDETNEELYRRFCSNTDERELRKLHDDLRHVLATILKEVTDLTGQSEAYESFMSHSMDALTGDPSVEEIRTVVCQIIEKTKSLRVLGRQTRCKLNETKEALQTLQEDFERVKKEASVDFLTGLANRKSFHDALIGMINEAASQQKELSLLIVDIDHFKKFNDEHGHLIGDEVLKLVAKKIKETIGERDFLARFGGEEFAVILPQTPLEGARVLAKNINRIFAQTVLKAMNISTTLGKVTVSVGVALYRPGELPDTLINRADRALYRAKQTGRNRVVTEQDIKKAERVSGGT